MRLNRSDTFKLSHRVSKQHGGGARTRQCTEGSFSIIPMTFMGQAELLCRRFVFLRASFWIGEIASCGSNTDDLLFNNGIA
jgi:hypothetical protein